MMKFNQKVYSKSNMYSQHSEDEIDINQIIGVLIRNKKLISKCIALGLIISGIFYLFKKEVWQGEFQIVLDTSNYNSGLNIDPSVLQIAGFQGGTSKGDQLLTEVMILQSPSVLMGIHDFVQKEHLLNNKNYTFNDFKGWKDNSLDISLEKNTSILNIRYRDTDENLVLPVLNKISNAYQEYSGKKKKRSIQLGIEFLENQIEKYKNKSSKSFRNVHRFAEKQKLGAFIIPFDKNQIPERLPLETLRFKASSKLKLIDQTLKTLKNTKDPNQILYQAELILGYDQLEKLPNLIKSIDQQITELSSKYKSSDISIQDLKSSRERLIQLLKKQVIGSLISKKEREQLIIDSSKRDKGVISRFRELLSEATKDNFTLNDLENQYRNILLEQSRNEDPWELITTPTLFQTPVEPIKSRFLVFGILGGFIFGALAATISEKKKGIIFSISEMNNISKFNIISDIPSENEKDTKEILNLILNGPLSEVEGKVALLIIGNLNNSMLNRLEESLTTSNKNNKFKITKSLQDSKDFSNLLLITACGITTKEQMNDMKNKISLQNKPVLGLIVFSKPN